MPCTTNVEDQQTHTDQQFMALTLIVLQLDLELVKDQILVSPFVPLLDKVLARCPPAQHLLHSNYKT